VELPTINFAAKNAIPIAVKRASRNLDFKVQHWKLDPTVLGIRLPFLHLARSVSPAPRESAGGEQNARTVAHSPGFIEILLAERWPLAVVA
jgi:hypothetical protein